MKITIESTEQIVQLSGVPARVWVGHSEAGVELHCFVTRIAVDKDADTSQFERELQEHQPPRPELVFYSARLAL